MITSLLNAETYLENITVILNVNISLPKHYIFECHDICHFGPCIYLFQGKNLQDLSRVISKCFLVAYGGLSQQFVVLRHILPLLLCYPPPNSITVLPSPSAIIPLHRMFHKLSISRVKQSLWLVKDPVWTVMFICSVDVLVSKFDFSPKEYPLRMPQPTPTQMKGDCDITRVCVNVAFPPLLEEFIPVTLSPSPIPSLMTLLRRTSVLSDRLKVSLLFWPSASWGDW